MSQLARMQALPLPTNVGEFLSLFYFSFLYFGGVC